MAEKYYSGIASELASKGRYGDSTLMHVNPIELEGLASLGPVTINPHTGLPEAFFWTVPMIMAAVGAVGGGIYGGVTAKKRGQGLGAGILTGLAMGGLGGYSLGGLGALAGGGGAVAPTVAGGGLGGTGAVAAAPTLAAPTTALAAPTTALAANVPAVTPAVTGLEGMIAATPPPVVPPVAPPPPVVQPGPVIAGGPSTVPSPITSTPGTPPLGNFDPSGVMAAEGPGFNPNYGMDRIPAIFNQDATVLEGAQALGGGEGTGIAQQATLDTSGALVNPSVPVDASGQYLEGGWLQQSELARNVPAGEGLHRLPPSVYAEQSNQLLGGGSGIADAGATTPTTTGGIGDVFQNIPQRSAEPEALYEMVHPDALLRTEADIAASADRAGRSVDVAQWFEDHPAKDPSFWDAPKAIGKSITDQPLPWALGTAVLADNIFGGDGGGGRDSGEDVVYTGEFASDVESGGRGERVYPVGEIPSDSSAERRYIFPYARA